MCYSLWYNAPMMLPAGNIVGADNEIYLLIKFIKSVHWRVAKYLSDIEEARCLKVKHLLTPVFGICFTLLDLACYT